MPSIKKPKVILLDIMETVVTEPFLNVMPAFFEMTRDEFLSQKDPKSWIEFEKGNITEQQYFDSFFSDRRKIDGPGLKHAMFNAYEWLPGMRHLVEQLVQADYPLFALSNYSNWYQLIDEKLSLSRYLKWDFVSCHTGYRKPDAQSYLFASSSLLRKPSECLFIDDRPVNVTGAHTVDMQAILFTNSTSLEKILIESSILT